jgi:uncharacterized protein involved in exopolysaccharide biosynthesis
LTVTPDMNGHAPAAMTQTAVANAVVDAPPPSDTTGASPVDDQRPQPRRRRLSGRHCVWLALFGLSLVLLGAAAGFGVASLTPPTYAARADILYLLTREQATGFLREDRSLSTQLVLLKSRTVIQPVADDWHKPIDDVTQALDAVVLQESEDIHVQFVDADPDRAQKMLDAIVKRYLEISNNDERADLRNYLDSELKNVLAQERQVRSEGQVRAAEMGPLVDREQWLRRQLDELRLSDLAGPAARVLVAPYVETEPIRPQPLVAAGTGALAGVVVALVAVAMVGRRRLTRQQWRTRRSTRG